MSEPKTPMAGDVMDIDVQPVAGRPYIVADMSLVANTSGPNPGIELILLAFQNRYNAQRFSVSAGDGGALMMTSGEFIGGQVIADLGTVRFNQRAALEAATLLFKHMVQNNIMSKDAVQAALRLEGVID